jgi:hypothetical protein
VTAWENHREVDKVEVGAKKCKGKLGVSLERHRKGFAKIGQVEP